MTKAKPAEGPSLYALEPVRTKKRYTKVIPKVLPPDMIAMLEECGMRRHTNAAIAVRLGCTEQEIEERRESDITFDYAIQRGQLKILDNAATVVVAAIQGTGVNGTPVTDEQLKAAQFYLEKHGPNWLRSK